MSELALPRWDVTDVFPSIGSREYAAAREAFSAELTRLTALYDEHDVRGDTERRPVDDASVTAFESVLAATNEVSEQARLLYGYLAAFVRTDARDDAAQGEQSQLSTDLAQLSRLNNRFDAWVAALGPYELAQQSPVADDHLFPLQRAELRASHQMSADQEDLLTDLQLTGNIAWNRLYTDLTARITAEVQGDELPMSAVRGLAFAPDGETRRAAYEAELEAWDRNAVPIVAALNAIKGEAASVNRRRAWSDDLEPALASNNVDRETLDAMQRAVVTSFPDFRRYLRAKAQLLRRTDGLPFYDLFAPVAGARSDRPWEEATADVRAAFGSYSDRLEGLATRAMEERWIDAEPRDGKGGGAFCMGLQGDRSLVLMNYDGSFRSVQTLAHELGHAYHNVNLADRTPMQRQTPMALAETASIFCETIMVERGLAGAAPEERLGLLEADLQGTCQVVVDIHSRFLFEKAFCEARAKRTLSVAETCQLMLEAQEQTYGDGLDPSLRHGYMWAAKPHYYKRAFYNWPYTFGLLFGIGLYARYREDEERFRASYDDLLSSTGLGEAAELGARFGIDVRDEAFWTASLDVIRRRIDEFVELATNCRQ